MFVGFKDKAGAFTNPRLFYWNTEVFAVIKC